MVKTKEGSNRAAVAVTLSVLENASHTAVLFHVFTSVLGSSVQVAFAKVPSYPVAVEMVASGKKSCALVMLLRGLNEGLCVFTVKKNDNHMTLLVLLLEYSRKTWSIRKQPMNNSLQCQVSSSHDIGRVFGPLPSIRRLSTTCTI